MRFNCKVVFFWVLGLMTPHPRSRWEVTLYHAFFHLDWNKAGRGCQECMHFAMLPHQECVVSQHTHSTYGFVSESTVRFPATGTGCVTKNCTFQTFCKHSLKLERSKYRPLTLGKEGMWKGDECLCTILGRS